MADGMIRYALWREAGPPGGVREALELGGGTPGRLAVCPLCYDPLAREVIDDDQRYLWLLLDYPVRVRRLERRDGVQFWGRRERAMKGHSALRSGDRDPVTIAAQRQGLHKRIEATMAADYEQLVPDPVDSSCALNNHRVRIRLP